MREQAQRPRLDGAHRRRRQAVSGVAELAMLAGGLRAEAARGLGEQPQKELPGRLRALAPLWRKGLRAALATEWWPWASGAN